jgi:hypothetical protein
VWYFELWRELNGLIDLNYVIRGCIVQESLKMEDENRWKRLDLYLLAHLAWAQLTNQYGLVLRDVRERVFNGVYRIGLHEHFGSHKDTGTDEKGKRTWMLSSSNRQSSMVMVSGWFGARMVERDLPPNM